MNTTRLHLSPAEPPARSPRGTVLGGAVLLALALVGVDLWLALLHRIDVPFVDGWPVLDRIMKFEHGEMSLPRFLLSPHGAHLHASVYAIALLDFVWLGGQQELQSAVSTLATALYCLLLMWLLLREGVRHGWHSLVLGCVAIAAAAVLSGLTDWETNLLPFQVVLTASRLVYIGLLWALAVALARARPRLYVAVMLASLPAVTLHGSGHLFAACIVVTHLLARQRWRGLAVALAPLVVAISIQYHYAAGGEFANLGLIFHGHALFDLMLAFFAYFASPFYGWLNVVDNRVLLAAGAALAGSTIVLTGLGVREVLRLRGWNLSLWWRQLRSSSPPDGGSPADPAPLFFAVLGVLLLLSGLAAAVLWVVRVEAGRPPWSEVFGNYRYAAYADLALLMPLAALLRVSPAAATRSRGRWRSVAVIATSVALLGLGVHGTLRTLATNDLRARTQIGLAAISVGLSPLLPMTEIVWPDSRADRYWSTELPRTIAWLRDTHQGPWRDLPALHAEGGAAYAAYPLDHAVRTALPAAIAPGWCRVTASLPAWGRALPTRSRIVPITTASGDVVGFAAMMADRTPADRILDGTVGCVARDTTPLFTPASAP